MNIQKAFDSLDQDFLLFALRNLVFGENFIHWIKFLLNKQQSCVINWGKINKKGQNNKSYINSDYGDMIAMAIMMIMMSRIMVIMITIIAKGMTMNSMMIKTTMMLIFIRY